MAVSAAARVGDLITTGPPAVHGCSLIASIVTGAPNVFIAGQPAAVVGSNISPHTIKAGNSCIAHPSPPALVNTGSSKVFIGGLPAARLGDSADLGKIIQGAPNVFIG